MRIIPTILIVVFFQFCSGKTNKQNEVSATDTSKFFQVGDYIKSQINEINKTPYFIYQLNISPQQKDSFPINNVLTTQLAQQFIKPDLNDASIKKYYNESVFFDQTTKTYTINYSTNNKDLELQNLDILLEEDGEKVKRIFMRKFFNYTDSSAMEQLSWKPNERFEITRMIQKPDGSETSRQTIVVWNSKS